MAKELIKERSPVIVIVGHVDHGKSTLLDYIRETKVVEGEAGGITQHLSAYEVDHKTSAGEEKYITFLDTPGHEAFQEMRSRGASVADIAILIVSSEDGVKAQTLEALKAIEKAKIPFVVAITKIDKPQANVEKVKQTLLENKVYLEGLGGDVPYTPISSKTGEGIPELLDLVLLLADLEELRGDRNKDASGVIIESHRDPKMGVSATLVIKDGTLKSGSYIVSGSSFAPTRIMQDFTGFNIKEASFSSPVTIIGFSDVPRAGDPFITVKSKKEAEKLAQQNVKSGRVFEEVLEEDESVLPIVIKTDVLGSLEAVQHELNKLKNDRIQIRIVHTGVGTISESDIKKVGTSKNALIVGFNVVIDAPAKELAQRMKIEVGQFDIIYKLGEWLEEAIQKRTPKEEVEEKHGEVKILKTFSQVKDKQVIGGRINEGTLSVGDSIKILRRDEEVGRGKILGLQQQKTEVKQIEGEGEFGGQFQSKIQIAPGDIIESFKIVVK